MKLTKYIFVLTILILAASCFNNSDLTLPDTQKLIIQKEDDSLVVSVKLTQSVIINNELTLTFQEVVSDSRCPINADCIWEGDGEVKFVLEKGNDSNNILLHTTLKPKYVEFAGYQIKLKSLNPYPQTTDPIKAEEYSVEVVVKNNIPGSSNSVQLISEEDNSVIYKDMANVKNVSLVGDELIFDIEYGGGCEEHELNLFAYKEIMESNPAQVTVRLSHNSNGDMCEALISKNVSFDLSSLKKYLKQNFNIQDKVVLLLFDSSGMPLRNPVIEYNY